MRMSQAEVASSASEYAALMALEATEAMYRFRNICPSCDGFGDHGYDEEGCMYVCYGCGGTGKYLIS